MTRYFERLPKKERIVMARKGGEALRSPALIKAWQEQEKIRGLYYEDIMTVKEIAKKYDINQRAVYRIINTVDKA